MPSPPTTEDAPLRVDEHLAGRRGADASRDRREHDPVGAKRGIERAVLIVADHRDVGVVRDGIGGLPDLDNLAVRLHGQVVRRDLAGRVAGMNAYKARSVKAQVATAGREQPSGLQCLTAGNS